MNPVTGLSLGRIAVGALSLAKPDLAASTMGAPASPMMTQWFGNREVAIGVATLLASGAARRNLVLVGVAVDAADAATAYAGLQSGKIPTQLGGALVGVAAVAAVSGLLGLRVKKKTVLVSD